jgi:hypothetical protein
MSVYIVLIFLVILSYSQAFQIRSSSKLSICKFTLNGAHNFNGPSINIEGKLTTFDFNRIIIDCNMKDSEVMFQLDTGASVT